MWKLPTFFTRFTTPFVSSRYTVVCTVVYAGRPFSGNASWTSRMEASPLVQIVSIISSSSLVSFGPGIAFRLSVFVLLSMYETLPHPYDEEQPQEWPGAPCSRPQPLSNLIAHT